MKRLWKVRMRRLLSGLLCLVMVLGMVPVMSLASGEDDVSFEEFSYWTFSGKGTLGLGSGVTGNGAQIVMSGAGEAVLTSQPVTVTAGENMRAGVSVKVPKGGEARLQLQAFEDMNMTLPMYEPIVVDSATSSDGFVELSIEGAIPISVPYACLQIAVGTSSSTKGETYVIDNAYIRAYTTEPELQSPVDEGSAQAGVWSVFFPTGTAAGDWAAHETLSQNPTGYNYAKIVSEGKNDSGALYFSRADVYEHLGVGIDAGMTPGQKYTLKAYVKCESAVEINNGGLQLYGNGDGTVTTLGAGKTVPNDGKWHQVSHTFTADRSGLYLFLSGSTYTSEVYVDNVRVLDASGKDMLNGSGNFKGDGVSRLSTTNRIPNGDFEDAAYTFLPLSEFNGEFEGAETSVGELSWQLLDSTAGTLEVAADQQGSCLAIKRGSADPVLYSPIAQVEAGRRYQLRFAVKGNTDYSLTGIFYDATGSMLSQWEPNVQGTATGSWIDVMTDVTAPEKAAGLRMLLTVQGTAGQTLYFDNAALHPYPDNSITLEEVADIAASDPGVKYQWYNNNGYTESAKNKLEIVEDGAADAGALHVYQADDTVADMQLALATDDIPEGTYTLTMQVKGSFVNNSEMLAFYPLSLENTAYKYKIKDQLVMTLGLGDARPTVSGWTTLVWENVKLTSTSYMLFTFSKYNWATDLYIDNVQLLDASGSDMLQGAGNFCTVTKLEATTTVQTPTALSAGEAASDGAYTGTWKPFLPAGQANDDWAAWDADNYAEITEDGSADKGALRIVRGEASANTGAAVENCLIVGNTYTLKASVKGGSLKLYGNGGGTLQGASDAWQAVELTFTADKTWLALYLTGQRDVSVDDLVVLDSQGNDVLQGAGSFCTVTEIENPDAYQTNALSIDTSKTSSDGTSHQGVWTPFFPTGTATGDWAAWQTETQNAAGYNYAEIVADGKDDAGALHFVRGDVYEHIGVSINAGMNLGSSYTLKLSVKGYGKATYGGLQLYNNGDGVLTLFGSGQQVPDDGQWHEITHTFTARTPQLNLFLGGGAYVCDVYVDGLVLLDAAGNDILNGLGSFCTKTATGAEPTIRTETATQVDTDSLVADAFTGIWMPFFPTGGEDTATNWYAWQTKSENASGYNYAQIVQKGNADVGALHFVRGDVNENIGVAVKDCLTVGQTYTLQLSAKGSAVATYGGLQLYGNGDHVLGLFGQDQAVPNDGAWHTLTKEFTADRTWFALIMNGMAYTCDVYVDNIQILDSQGNDVLQGAGGFYTESARTTTVKEPGSIDTGRIASDGVAYETWTPFYPLGKAEGDWAAWQTKEENATGYNYAEVAEDGYEDAGALHFVRADVYEHIGLAIDAGLTPGAKYTIELAIKSNAAAPFGGLQLYANGDTMLAELGEGKTIPNDGQWHTISAEFTADRGVLQLLLGGGNYVSDVYVDNIRVLDASGRDMLNGAGGFYVETEVEVDEEALNTPDTTTNLLSGGDFELLSAVAIPGWSFSGSALFNDSTHTVTLLAGASMQSLRYNVEAGHTYQVDWTGSGGTLTLSFGSGGSMIGTKTVSASSATFSVPEKAEWLRVTYAAGTGNATVSSITFTYMGSPVNLDFELTDPATGKPLNWTDWLSVNVPGLKAEDYNDAYTVTQAVGEGVDGGSAMKVVLNQNIPDNKDSLAIGRVLDSIHFTAKPSTVYSFTYHVKITGEGGVYPQIFMFQANGSQDGSTNWLNGAYCTDNSGQWKTYTTTFSTGALTDKIMVRMDTKAVTAGTQILIDNITISEMGDAGDPNLDFEQGQAGMIPLNWSSYERDADTGAEGNFGAYSVTLQPNGSADGSGAMKVQKLTDMNGEVYILSTYLEVEPSTGYYFSYDAMTQYANDGDSIQIMLRQKNADKLNVSDETKAWGWTTSAYATGNFNWSEYGAVFETAEDCRYVQICFVVIGHKGYTAWFDNASLTKVDLIDDPNYDFEYSIGQTALNWRHQATLASGKMSVETENVYSGSHALRIQRSNGELDHSFIWSEKWIDVSAGDEVEFVAHVSSRNSISGQFTMAVFGYGPDDDTTMIGTMYGQERVTNAGEAWSQWDTYHLVYTVPKGVTRLQLMLRVGGTQADVLVDDIEFYNYTQSENVIYAEDFKKPSVTTGLFGGWTVGQTTGKPTYGTSGEMQIIGGEEDNGEVYTELYTLMTDYVYTVTAPVYSTGTATGELVMQAYNWKDEPTEQVVLQQINTATNVIELKSTFEAPSATYYRLFIRKTGGDGKICVQDVTIQQTGTPSEGITWIGKWLTHPDETVRLSDNPHPFTERYYYFRQEVYLDKEVEFAQMQITADDKFTLYVNGMQVYNEERSGDTWDLPVTVDLSGFMTQGKNVIAVKMYNDIYAYGLLYDGIVKMADDTSLRFYSSKDTLVAAGSLSNSIVTTPNPKWTEADEQGFMNLDYDTSTCSLWMNADEYASVGGGNWGSIDFDPTEYSDYKIESNSFTFPEEPITAGDTVTVEAQMKIETALPTTNSFQVSFWKRNTTSQICTGTVTIADGKTTDDWPIGEEFTATFEMKVPEFLAEGEYTVQFENIVAIISDYFINNKVGNIEVVQIERELTTTSSVEMIDGQATWLVNGVEKAPMWFARPERSSLFDPETVTSFSNAGVDTVVTYIFLTNLYGDVWTKEDGFVPDAIDAMMLETLEGNSDAQLVVALDFSAPDWWLEENPDELVTLSNGVPDKTNATYASEKWKQDAGAIMVEAIEYMMQQPYANNIVGFKLTGGYTLEWNWWGMSSVVTDVGDYSAAGIAAFRAWLTEKYGTDEALQQAYGNKQITLANAMPPSIDLRMDTGLRSVLTVQDSLEIMDYQTFMAELKVDTIEYFADLVTEAVDDRLIVGTYAGYFYSGGMYEYTSSVSNVYFNELLELEDLDFIKSPWMYGMREIGDSIQYMGPVDSVSAHGKLWVVEEDSRLNLKKMSDGQDSRASVGWTRSYKQSVEHLKRDFSYVLSKGMGISFYNLGWGYTDDDQYYGAISQMHQEMTLSLGLNSESTADIAVFCDGESNLLAPYEDDYENETLFKSVFKNQLEELGHIGASYDLYEIDDLVSGLVPAHKINVFLGTTLLDAAERAAIEEQLQKDGNILVWMFTDAISDGETTDVSLMSELTGMNLSIISTGRKQIATAKVFNNSHWLTQGMNDGQPYGVEAYDKLAPVIAVQDSSATALAYHSTTDGTAAGQVALAVKDMGDWTSIYSAVPNMPQLMFRNMLEKVDGHIYSGNGSDVIYANSNYVALHSLFEGTRTITLPSRCTVYDVFNRQIIATDTDTFEVTFDGVETRLFRLTETNTAQVYVTRTAGGTVSEQGLTNLTPGDDMTFTVQADEGYQLSYLFIDGVKTTLQGDSYTFEDVNESHTVIAHFTQSYKQAEEPSIPEEPPVEAPQDNTWLIITLCAVGVVLLAAVIAVVVVVQKKKKRTK